MPSFSTSPQALVVIFDIALSTKAPSSQFSYLYFIYRTSLSSYFTINFLVRIFFMKSRYISDSVTYLLWDVQGNLLWWDIWAETWMVKISHVYKDQDEIVVRSEGREKCKGERELRVLTGLCYWLLELRWNGESPGWDERRGRGWSFWLLSVKVRFWILFLG